MFKLRTTIAVNTTTKAKLDKSKAPGQCYDGFLCQLIELRDQTNGNNSPEKLIPNTHRRHESFFEEVAKVKIQGDETMEI